MQSNGSGATYIHANTNLTVNGPIYNTGGGAVNIIKDDIGTLTLGGATSNSFGWLNTSDGTVVLSKSAGYAVANALSILGNATVRLTASNQIDPGTMVSLNDSTGSTLLDLHGNNNNFSGGLIFNYGGQLSTGAGTAFLGSDVVSNGITGTAYIYGNLNLGSGSMRTFNIAKGNNSYDMQIAATISGNENFNKTGPGTLYLTGSNTFVGTITISGGILEADSASNLGNNPVNLAGGSLAFTQTVNGAFSSSIGLAATSAIDSGSNSVSIASNISGTGTLSKVGAGILTLTGTNTATGGIIINAGTIQVVSDISLGAATAPITLNGGILAAVAAVNLSTGMQSTNGSASAVGAFALVQPLIITPAGGTISAVNTVITLSSPINWSGGSLTLASGTLTANISSGAVTFSGSSTLTIMPAATFNDSGTIDPLAAGGKLINVFDSSSASFNVLSGSKRAGTISGVGNTTAGNTTVSAGATLTATDIQQNMLTVLGSAMIAAQSPHNSSAGVSVVSSLVLTNGSNVLAGRLDLGNNDLVIHNADLTTITAQIANAYQTGGAGIASSTALSNTTHLTVLGVLQNNQSGTALYTATNQFDTVTPGAADILIKYTYFGDTNLDGKVDASDYSRIDAAYLADITNPAAMTGWFNGDFNYDGVINGSDYTLIDNAFNSQGAALAASIAEPTAQIAEPTGGSAVPEPTAIAVLGTTALALLTRRSKRRGARSTQLDRAYARMLFTTSPDTSVNLKSRP